MRQEEEGLDTKKDRSLVTAADYAVQALISSALAEAFPGVPLVAEEDTSELRGDTPEARAMVRRVVESVNGARAEGGLAPMSDAAILAAIDRGGAAGGGAATGGRHWVLDPVDGTFGFVRGDQYAVALALVAGASPVVALLGCPNMPAAPEYIVGGGAAAYGFPPRAVAKMLAGARGVGGWCKGVLFTAARGRGAWAEPSRHVPGVAPQKLGGGGARRAADARFCEPVLKANSSQSFTAAVAASLGLSAPPLRIYSQVKYGAVARGDADIFMKFAKPGYQEKSWDHAAGALIVEEAGGAVTDAGGKPLDFSGRFVGGLDRGIVASTGGLHAPLLAAVAGSWAEHGASASAGGE